MECPVCPYLPIDKGFQHLPGQCPAFIPIIKAEMIKVLEKPERRLVLRIMDAQSLMAEERSMDSFISGFELAWQLFMELNQFEKERSVSRCTSSRRSGALSMSGEEEEP